MNFPHASESFKRRNPHLFGLGALASTQPQPDRRKSEGDDGGKETRSLRMVVSFLRCGRRLLDDDNLSGSLKYLRDAIASTLGIDDGDPRIRWEYAQRRTDGQTGILVKIELSDPRASGVPQT